MTIDQILTPKPAFDNWGRYKLRLPGDAKPKGRTRVTTFIGALDDKEGLIDWKAAATMVGALRDKGTMSKWAALFAETTDPWYHSDETKKRVKALVRESAEKGGAQSRADIGTSLHTMLELVARGESPALVEPYASDIEAFLLAMAGAQVSPVPEWTEVTVYIEQFDLVGTFDGLFQTPHGLVLGDYKTEASTDYKALAHAAQLGAYSLATHRIVWPADPNDEATLEPLPDFDRWNGLIVHIPAGEGQCTLHQVDLQQGRDALQVCAEIRGWRAANKRKDTGGLMRPWEIGAAAGVALGEVAPAAVPTFEEAEGDPADPADITLASSKYDALDPDAKARVNAWLKEAATNPRDCRAWALGGGNHTTRRLALVESSIAVAQEGWTDDEYRSLIAITGKRPDSFTAPIGVLLGAMDHTQATGLYQAIQHAARHKEQTSNAV